MIDALVPNTAVRGELARRGVDVLIAEIGEPAVADALADADVVFNLAGQVSHIESMRDPLRDLQLNTMHATLAFLEHAPRRQPRRQVVHTSTRQVYGIARRPPVDEEHPTRPVDVNGVAKLAGEQLHIVYANAHGMADHQPASDERLRAASTPDQRPPRLPAGVLPQGARAASGSRSSATARSAATACTSTTSSMRSSPPPPTGSSARCSTSATRGVSLASIAKLIVEAAGTGAASSSCRGPTDAQRIDIGSFRTDCTRSTTVLGWGPRIALADGIAATVDFYRGDAWYLSST